MSKSTVIEEFNAFYTTILFLLQKPVSSEKEVHPKLKRKKVLNFNELGKKVTQYCIPALYAQKSEIYCKSVVQSICASYQKVAQKQHNFYKLLALMCTVCRKNYICTYIYI